MKFLELNLVAFGPFTDVSLDFTRGDAGLHLVYGLNEAGKSSALRAIHAALFGVPHQTADNFVHDHQALRLSASLQSEEGNEIRFVRRKGRKETLLNNDPELGPYPDNALDPFLGSIDGETFSRVFAIGHDELRAGGEQMKALQGLCGESLFAAGLGNLTHGGWQLPDVLQSLDQEAAELFSPKKRNSAIKVAKSEYDQATKEKRAAEISSTQWQRLHDELLQATEDLASIRNRETDHKIRAVRLGRLRDALKPLHERQRLLEELAQLGDVRVLPDAYSSQERAKSQAALEAVKQQLASIELELEGASGLTAQIATITIPDDVIENEQAIAALQEHLGAHLKAMRDRSTILRTRRTEALAQIASLRRALGIDSDCDLQTLRLPADHCVGIQNLANDEKRLRAKPNELAARLVELQYELQTSKSELAELSEPRDGSELRSAIDEGRGMGDLDQQLDAQRQALATLKHDAGQKLAVLSLWRGSLAELARLPVPLKETIERFEADFAETIEIQKSKKAKQEERSTELAQVCEEMAALRKTDHVPTEEELRRLRERRQHGWDLVRKVWLESCSIRSPEISEFAGESGLAEAYELAVAKADQIADRLRREADRVVRLATQLERKSQLESLLVALQSSIEENEGDRRGLQSNWCRLWEPLGIEQPLTPREMRSWLDRHAELASLAREIERGTNQLQATEERYTKCAERMTLQLTKIGERIPVHARLCDLLAQGTRVLEEEHAARVRRAEIQSEQSRLQREMRRVGDQKLAADSELAEWQISWRQAMGHIGCPEDAPAAQANERMSRLHELFERIDDLERIDMRIRDIDADAVTFETEVKELVDRLAPDLSQEPAVQAAAQLRSRLDQARTDKARLDELVHRERQRRGELTELRRQDAQLEQQVNQLCRMAGVDAVERLVELEQASEEVTKRRDRLSEVDDRLLELSAGRSIDELAADASQCDYDELTAQIDSLNDEIEQFGLQREAQAARVSELQRTRDAIDGSGASAHADEQSLGILSRMHADAERYLRLRMAATLLRYRIDKFRTENQDPLLTRASQLFARLTCHEFSGLRTEYVQNDQPVIVALRRNNQSVPVAAMSDGTRDQLYFALRLAYLERRLVRSEPLPFIVDDVLINFDNVRAAATLNVLAELSRKTQVIFFTHHRHLIDIARSQIGRDLCVHELGREERVPV